MTCFWWKSVLLKIICWTDKATAQFSLSTTEIKVARRTENNKKDYTGRHVTTACRIKT